MAVLTGANCRKAIRQLIQSVPNTGQVHERRRVVRDEASFKTHLWDVTNSRICGWFITLSRSNPVVNERNPGYNALGVKGGGNVITTFQFQIEGMFGVNDAADSETTFSNLVYAVADEFEAYGGIPVDGVPIPAMFEQLPTTVEEWGYLMFAGSFLVHYARLEVGFRGRTRPNP